MLKELNLVLSYASHSGLIQPIEGGDRLRWFF